MPTELIVGGRWLFTIGPYGELKWSTVADGGLEEISWRMPLPDTFSHPALRTGALVQLKSGPGSLGYAKLSQPNVTEDGWDFTAIGLDDELRTAHLCLDSGGNTTSTPDVAVDQAIADGFNGTRPVSLSAGPYAQTNATDAVNYVGDLLDAWATSESKRWRVDSDGRVVAAVDPTTPTWFMTPGSARIGLADDDYASDLYLRYRSGATTFATVHVSDPLASAQRRKAVPVDLTSLGVITSGKATSVGNGMLAKGKARYAWTDAVNPSRLQLTTPGGQPAFLPFVKAGDLVRTFGVTNEQGLIVPYFDWVIGKTEYEDGADTIQLAPTQLAARNLGDILTLAVS